MRTLVLSLLLFPSLLWAKDPAIQPALQTQTVAKVQTIDSSADTNPQIVQKLQANVALHTLEELKKLLLQAEKIANGETQYNTEEPIAVVLHGEEIKAFVRSNYRSNKELVDLAARLDAFNVIDVKVCKRWMGANGIMANQLPPFVEPVPYGMGEIERLQKAGYAYF
jgi:intracellular sulfur oxidation DsrE/DsrF family protein